MLALRSFARSLPRAVTRISKPFAPRAATFVGSRQQPVLRAFSTSIWRREPAGELLSAKLGSELQLELGNQQNEETNATINDYFSNSPFTVEDKAGTHNVILTRQFGNENIRIEFSVADMSEIDDEFDGLDEDSAFGDEDPMTDSINKNTINQSGVKGGKVDVVPEDSVAPSDREGAYDDQAYAGGDSQYPLHLAITITKPGLGATVIQALAQNGAIDVSNLTYFPKAELVEPKTPEDVQESESVYAGPAFSTLDSELQAMVSQYLEERGVNAELAEILPHYVDYKEQKEYVGLLENLKKFVDA